MRIGYFISQYPTASHTFVRREIQELRSRGIDIQTFSIRPPSAIDLISSRDKADYDETDYLLPVGIAALLRAHLAAFCRRPVRYVSVLKLALEHRVPGLKALIWALFHFAESIILADRLRAQNIQHVHNHFANAGANISLLAANFLQLPWSLTLHGISETDYPAGLLLGAKIERAKFVACVSDFGRAQTMRVTPPSLWHKLFISRCGINLESTPKKTSRSGSCPRIICVGRLSPEKGQLGLLEAFYKLRIERIEAELVVVGDGPERSNVEKRVQELGISDNVTMTGRLDEESTLAEIAKADILVVPSFMEGLPIVLMEAMAIGIPVVATRVAGIPELVSDEREGLLFHPAQWDDLADKLKLLLGDLELRSRLSVAARAKIEAEYNISMAVQPLLAKFSGRVLCRKGEKGGPVAACEYLGSLSQQIGSDRMKEKV